MRRGEFRASLSRLGAGPAPAPCAGGRYPCVMAPNPPVDPRTDAGADPLAPVRALFADLEVL